MTALGLGAASRRVAATALAALAALAWSAWGARGQAPEARPLAQAHAHNDYAHARPLLDALDHGFCSVEADVFLVNGRLLVGHTPSELRADRTLEALYLEPLSRRVAAHGGRVYKDGPVFTLLVDFKSAAGPTYERLQEILPRYRDMLGRFEDGRWLEGAVRIVLSGNRPVEEARRQATRYVGIDGRTSDLDSTAPAHFMPMISDRWGSLFSWEGDGPMPEEERLKLEDYVARCRRAGRAVRFWASPEKESVWAALADAGVDYINTDDLAGLQKFLTSRAP
jgi:hypothetical protein